MYQHRQADTDRQPCRALCNTAHLGSLRLAHPVGGMAVSLTPCPTGTVAISDTGATPPEGYSLQASEIRFRRLFEAAQDGILMLDAGTGEITAANPFLARLLGYSDTELLGKKLWEISPFDDTGKSKIAFKELQSEEYIRYDDLPLETRDGRSIDVEFVSNVYLSGSDRIIQCNIRDITDRKATRRAQQTSDERYRALFDYAPDGITITNREGRYVDVNPSICRMSGYSRDELLGLRASDLVAPVDLPHLNDALSTIAIASEYQRDYQLRHKDGSAVAVNVMATGMPDGNLLAIVRDVTEHKALEAQVQQTQKMEAIGRLAGGIAHDFNNLLTVILGSCELLLDGIDPDDPKTPDIEEIQTAGTRAAGLTRQLLAFSRKEIIEPALLDLNAILADLQPMLHRLIKEHITIRWTPQPVLPRIKADRGQMEQVVINLALNAQDAMPSGGTLTIETANRVIDERRTALRLSVTPGRYVVLTVTDTGAGMTPEVREHIFEPFFTTKATGKGTGLGLATVHGIVARIGGGVNVSTEAGRGTTFEVYLPEAAPADTTVTVPERATPPGTGTERVLVVEDNAALRGLTRRLLERQGYVVVVAANATEALRQFEDQPGFDVLLTDVVMPGRSGPDLAKQLVEHQPELKVVYMSGYTEEAVVQRGVLNPGIAFLHKPFTAEALGRKLRGVLDASLPH